MPCIAVLVLYDQYTDTLWNNNVFKIPNVVVGQLAKEVREINLIMQVGIQIVNDTHMSAVI